MLQSSCYNQPQHHLHQCPHQSTRHQQQHPRLHHNQHRQRGHYGLSLTVLPLLVALLFLSQCPPCTAVIVPNELPSILSLVYSNIPPIKKGTDSRVGFGFRLGEHADFQVMVELGPQKETRPVGDQDSGSSFNKRQVNKTQQRAVQRELAKTERPPSTWLEKWSNQANVATTTKKKVGPKTKPSKKPVVYKQVPVQLIQPQMPSQAIQQLQMLYQMATSTSTSTTTTTTTTTTEKPLPQAIENTSMSVPSTYLLERLQLLKAPAIAEELQALMQKSQEKTKTEITEELMDVNLDE